MACDYHGTPAHRLESAADAASGDTVTVLAGDCTDCGCAVPAGSSVGDLVTVSVADVRAAVSKTLNPKTEAPTPEPEPEPVEESEEPLKSQATKNKRTSGK